MSTLFRGYVPTDGKKAIKSFKNKDDLDTLEDVKDLPSYAGVLADETILIDIDDMEQSEIMMQIVEDLQLNCRVYQTTRGRHFLFKNSVIDKCGTHLTLACGLTADIKVGTKNSYEVLKIDGKKRHIEWDVEDDLEYQEVPKWLYPVVGSKTDFLTMNAGDGRNQAIFTYILTLQSNDFTVDESREAIRILNAYILKEPLSDRELDTILRSDSFQKPVFFKGSNFLFDKFAAFIKNNNYIIKLNNQLHIYKDGVYVDGEAMIEAEMIHHLPSLNRAKRQEVMAYLNLLIRDNSNVSNANLIAFKNGIYNLHDDSFREFSPDVVVTNKIDWDYIPGAYSELVDKTLNKIACQDTQVRALLEEAIGYTFYRRNELGKAFILIGDRSNGKSTFLDMVKTTIGERNISSLDLGELGDRFKTAELFGKLANIGDDIGDEFIANPAIFKKVVTGDRINVEHKGQDPFEFNNYSKLLFSANNIPRIKDKTGAVQRRLTIIPFDAKFSVDDPDYRPYIKYELRERECIEYLIQIGITGLKRVLVSQRFSTSDRVQRELDEYEEANNPIIRFLHDLELDHVENEPTNKVYKQYHEYCLANNLQPMSNVEFSKIVKKKYDMDIVDKKINGTKCRIFVRVT